jgi:hypothetical protein
MASPFFPEVTAAWQAAVLENNEIPADQFLAAASKFVPIFGYCSRAYVRFFYLTAFMNFNRLSFDHSEMEISFLSLL